MEKLRAKAPDGEVFWTMSYMVRMNDSKPVLEKDSDLQPHVRDALGAWLETCEGDWRIITHNQGHPEIEFDQEADYVRYCFEWL